MLHSEGIGKPIFAEYTTALLNGELISCAA
jgi:hypothetical protein